MTDGAPNGQPTVEQAALADAAASDPARSNGAGLHAPASGAPAATADEHPELLVGAAFAGGLVLALLLKRLAR